MAVEQPPATEAVQFVRDAQRAFAAAGSADPLGDSLRLFDLVTAGALRRAGRVAPLDVGLDLPRIARARADGEPLDYAVGYAPFFGRLFHSEAGALIPREETELLVSTVLRLLDLEVGSEATAIDVGTGSGNLAVTLALELPQLRVHASDITEDAVRLVRKNVRFHSVGDRVAVHLGSLFDPYENLGIEGRVDLVVCNPPYIPRASVEKLPDNIRKYEPREAFDGGSFGIDIFRGLIAGSARYLKPGGIMAFEFGAGQDRLVQRLLQGAPFEDLTTHPDAEGTNRVFSARRVEFAAEGPPR